MDRFGWKLGDRITVIGGPFPVNLDLTIRGVYDGPDENGLWFQYDYYNELMREYLPGAEITRRHFGYARAARKTSLVLPRTSTPCFAIPMRRPGPTPKKPLR